MAGCLDELSRQVRAGRSLGAAIEGATVEPVAAIARQLLTGTPLAQAARAALTGVGRGSDDAIALSAVTVSADLGGNQALALDLAASSLRDRAAQRSEMNAASATARLSAKVVGGLPLAAGLWLLGTDRGARSFLAGSRAGVICLVVSAGLQVLGWSWIGRLVSAVE